MDLGDPNHSPSIGDYNLGPRIGLGSFAVVWRSTHRQSGVEFAIKEIDKIQLSPKVSENLRKEISILRTISHRNIVHLFEVIETKDRIYLVMECCDGGDLAAYLNRRGKVSEAVARHFMRQLAAGLQMLQSRHLIHRDLKPQNLLLMTNEETPPMKIGDFGFARPLTPDGLADTLCGSPLYMAPEIMLNQKYDARADLWSVGAILFQLVTGRPPFNGSNHIQLFHNILSSTELPFPDGALEELHPDCVDLCRCLLRQNPDERLTFKEFFCHNFLGEPGSIQNSEQSSYVSPSMKLTLQSSFYASSMRPLLLSSGIPPMNPSSKSGNLKLSPIHDNIQIQKKDLEGTSVGTSDHGNVGTVCGVLMKSIGREPNLSVVDSMESIEKDYVLVNTRSATVEAFSYYPGASLLVDSSTRSSSTFALKQKEQDAESMQMKQLACDVESSLKLGSDLLPASSAYTIPTETHGLYVSNPSTRLHHLCQYVEVIAALSQEKYNAGLFTEAFSLELVVLAIWRKILDICSTWLFSRAESELPGNSSTDDKSNVDKGGAGLQLSPEDNVDFSNPSSVSTWAEQAFIVAFNRAEKLSDLIKNMDDAAEMPDAMELIFQKALAVGTIGAFDEYEENKEKAFASYSRALLVLSFIAEEATSLPLKPPFSLTPSNKKRIQQYIMTLNSRQVDLLKSNPFLNQQTGDSRTD